MVEEKPTQTKRKRRKPPLTEGQSVSRYALKAVRPDVVAFALPIGPHAAGQFVVRVQFIPKPDLDAKTLEGWLQRWLAEHIDESCVRVMRPLQSAASDIWAAQDYLAELAERGDKDAADLSKSLFKLMTQIDESRKH